MDLDIDWKGWSKLIVAFILGMFLMFFITFAVILNNQPKEINCERAVDNGCCNLNQSSNQPSGQTPGQNDYTCSGIVPSSAPSGSPGAYNAELYCLAYGTCPSGLRCISVEHHATLINKEYYTCECGTFSYGV